MTPGTGSGADERAGELRRDLRLADAVAIGLGAMVGAGLFVVTGVAARVAGPAFLAGLVLAGIAATCNALSSAQLAAAYPRSGGTYEYGNQVLGRHFGFAAGWMFLASKLAAGGTVALGLGAAVAALWPGVPERACAAGAAVALTAANHLGIRKAGRLNSMIVLAVVSTLVVFVVAGLPAMEPSNFRPFAPRGMRGALEAAALLFFAYTGYARLATLGEEVRDPARTIPRAIVIALSAALVLYVAVGVVAVGAVGADALGGSDAPLVVAAAALPMRGLDAVVGTGSAIAMLGVLLSQIFAISRVLFAMGRGGDLPRFLGQVHPARGVPDRAVLVTGAIVLVVALVGSLAWVVPGATFTILLYYAITNLAALRMPRESRRYPGWIAVLGLVFCTVLAAAQRPLTIAAGLGVLALGFGLRRVRR